MADDRGSSAAAVVLAFLSGAALGVVAALLLAPQTGRESREQLRGYARRAEDDLRDVAGRGREAIRRSRRPREGVCGVEDISPARGVRRRSRSDATRA